MTENGCESSIVNKTAEHTNAVVLQRNRDLTAIVEIARLQKPVSQVRILPGAPSDQRRCKPAQDLHN